MKVQRFLKEELPAIDSDKEQKTTYTYEVFSLIDLLAHVKTEHIFYFESKEEDFCFLGLGKGLELSPREAARFMSDHPDHFLVYQGFFETHPSPLIYLPEWSFIQRKGQVELFLRNRETPARDLFHPSAALAPWPAWAFCEDVPSMPEWEKRIQNSLHAIDGEELKKIVLVCKKHFSYSTPLDALSAFIKLYAENRESSHFSLYHQFNKELAFASFTPERLLTLKGKALETISLAGSTPRGKIPEEDMAQEALLQSSLKLAHEHELVTAEIAEKLRPLVSEYQASALKTMKLPYIQHREVAIKATLQEGVDVMSLIHLLHPTPAVGGLPSQKARAKIAEIEGEERRYYAAPVGVISASFSEIAVGIRSALFNSPAHSPAHSFAQVTLYGGVGIVSGSDPGEEWEEAHAKMRPFLKVMDGGSR